MASATVKAVAVRQDFEIIANRGAQQLDARDVFARARLTEFHLRSTESLPLRIERAGDQFFDGQMQPTAFGLYMGARSFAPPASCQAGNARRAEIPQCEYRLTPMRAT
jgi:hypothetical protein